MLFTFSMIIHYSVPIPSVGSTRQWHWGRDANTQAVVSRERTQCTIHDKRCTSSTKAPPYWSYNSTALRTLREKRSSMPLRARAHCGAGAATHASKRITTEVGKMVFSSSVRSKECGTIVLQWIRRSPLRSVCSLQDCRHGRNGPTDWYVMVLARGCRPHAS